MPIPAFALLGVTLFVPQEPVRYERVDESWFRVEETGRFAIDPRSVSVRFRSPVTDLAELIAVAGDPTGLLAAASTVRANRLGVHDLELAEGSDVLAVRDALRASGWVEFAEENTIGVFTLDPDDTEFGLQWALENTGQSGGVPGADIDARGAWDLTTGAPSVVVAVVDASVNVFHPDLAPNMFVHPGEIPGNGIDDDSNGFVDDVHGWNFSMNRADVSGFHYHGSFVTGIVSAQTNNAEGIAGVAGGWLGGDGARSMACVVGDFAPNSTVVDDAIVYAADNGARVVTLALTIGSSSALDAALDYARDVKGVFIDCASGNHGANVSYPARDPRVVAVASSDRHDEVSSFSNSGSQIWVAAPGEDIRSTDIPGYRFSSGTSFAAPHVAGTIALTLSAADAAGITISVAGLENVLKVAAEDIGPAGFDPDTGWGRIDARRTLEELLAGDCNDNGTYDFDDIEAGTSQDADGDGIPDECQCPPPGNYCVTSPNSAGPGAVLSTSGSSSIASNDLVLHASGLPTGEPCRFLFGPAATQRPLFDGFLCVELPLVRLPLVTTGAGVLDFAVDLGGLQVAAGGTGYFQLVYRDSVGVRGNLSDGVAVVFCP
ncbi:MAG: S8 family serine peptidase [bacterium]|nr:S8 family serine peptidase [bacterium]